MGQHISLSASLGTNTKKLNFQLSEDFPQKLNFEPSLKNIEHYKKPNSLPTSGLSSKINLFTLQHDQTYNTSEHYNLPQNGNLFVPSLLLAFQQLWSKAEYLALGTPSWWSTHLMPTLQPLLSHSLSIWPWEQWVISTTYKYFYKGKKDPYFLESQICVEGLRISSILFSKLL